MRKMKKYSASVVFLAFLLTIAILAVVLPKSSYSENEKRVLAEFPGLTGQAVTDGSFGKSLETYLADHFPLRDLWVGLNAYAGQALGQNGVSGIYAGKDGYLIAEPAPYQEETALRNIRVLREFAEKAGLPATILTVPNAGYMMDDKLPVNHKPYYDEKLFDLIRENAGQMQVLDLRDMLPEGAYYRTDHHLTSAGAYAMYRAYFPEGQAFSCTDIYPGFYGTGYSKSGLWLTKPDDLEVWEVPGDFTVTIRDGATSATYDSLYFPVHLGNMDKYPVFLDGNHQIVTVDNPNLSNGRRLLILKDSYAHCFATFAASQCEQVCMVDLRYYKGSVSGLLEEYGCTEILYLYGAENLATSTDIPWLM